MTKKMGLLVFCGVIVFTYFSCTQGTSQSDVTSGTFNNSARTVTSELKAVQYADYLTFAKQVLEKYYRNKDLGETNDFSKDVSANSLKLLNAKVEMWQLKNSMCNISYADYNISITPFKKDKWTNAGDEYSVILRIERSWFYTFFKNGVRTKSKSRTTSSEVLNIKLFRNHDGIYKILECCNHYDTTFGDLDERYQNALLNGDCLDTLLTQYKNNFKDASIKSSEQLLIDLQGESCKSDVLEVRAYTSLNRSSIVTWARNNFDSNQPISSTPLVDYYDFSEILGAYDCTNFASHALLAGGATLHDDGNSGIVGSGQWYYRSLANRSSLNQPQILGQFKPIFRLAAASPNSFEYAHYCNML